MTDDSTKRRKPSLSRMLAAARKAGAILTTPEGYTFRFGETGESAAARGNSTDAELEEFEARHGQT